MNNPMRCCRLIALEGKKAPNGSVDEDTKITGKSARPEADCAAKIVRDCKGENKVNFGQYGRSAWVKQMKAKCEPSRKTSEHRSASHRCPNGSITVNSQHTHIREVQACAASTLMYVNACHRPPPPPPALTILQH